jgi:hypothetical protein
VHNAIIMKTIVEAVIVEVVEVHVAFGGIVQIEIVGVVVLGS